MWDWATGGRGRHPDLPVATTSGSFSWTGTFGLPAVLKALGLARHHVHPQPDPSRHLGRWRPTPRGAHARQQDARSRSPSSPTVAKAAWRTGRSPRRGTWLPAAPGRHGSLQLVRHERPGEELHRQRTTRGGSTARRCSRSQAELHGPVVVAGTDTEPGDYSGTGCRVCHVVAGGRRVEPAHRPARRQPPTTVGSYYDLKNANAETVLTGNDSTFGWGGLFGDGSTTLVNTAQLSAGNQPTSQLYAFPPAAAPATPLTVTGLPANLQAGAPAFSADGNHIRQVRAPPARSRPHRRRARAEPAHGSTSDTRLIAGLLQP